MKLQQWPRAERPREKLLRHGAAGLSDAELLAIFIRNGIPGRTALDLARECLNRHQDMYHLLSLSVQELCDIKGIGPTTYTELQAAVELGQRYLRVTLKQRDLLTSPTLTQDYLSLKLKGRKHEVFACLYLDNQHQLLDYQELFRGTIDGAAVYVREVVKETLARNAAAVIFCHNHPSGVAEPSQADVAITERLREALALIEVRVLDHIIIGASGNVSFAERGLL